MTVEKRAAKVPLTRKPRVPMARGSVMGCVASNAPTHPFPTSTADAFKGWVMARSRSRASRSMAEPLRPQVTAKPALPHGNVLCAPQPQGLHELDWFRDHAGAQCIDLLTFRR
jgi:hypothetical protein